MSTFTIDTATSRATPSPVPGKRTTAPSIRARKVEAASTEQPIVMLTAYTMRMAQLLDPHCDMLLVGDSLGQVIYGLPSTIPVTLEMMCAHGAAVVRGSWHALVAVDMPFGSYEASPEQAFANRLADHEGNRLRGGQARGRRSDGADHRVPHPSRNPGDRPRRPDAAGGQRARRLWRARPGGREADKIIADASAVAEAGAFCIVVEGVLEEIATEVARSVALPVIGIGASADCDGQVLVTEDMLGLFERTPRFVKRYDDLASRIGEAARELCRGSARAQLPERRPDLSPEAAHRVWTLGPLPLRDAAARRCAASFRSSWVGKEAPAFGSPQAAD